MTGAIRRYGRTLPYQPASIRFDLQIVADMIDRGSRILDVGCGDGTLLEYLLLFKQTDGRGLEISQQGVTLCVQKGLSVVQGDADTDLDDYPSGLFDFVILSQTLQAMRDPKGVLENLLRISRHAIVSFPNFAYWPVRAQFLWRGRMPVTAALPATWYETANTHLCTVRDFFALCEAIAAPIEHGLAIGTGGRPRRIGSIWRTNLFAEQAIFMLKGR